MPEKKTKVQMPPKGLVDAFEVTVRESTERWSDIELSDGTTLRIKPVVLSAVRIENEWDPDGNPIYQVKVNQVMTAMPPDHLKKGAGSAKPH